VSKTLILGSTGMLGATVARYLSEQGHEIVEGNRSGITVGSNSKAVKLKGLSTPDLASIFQSEEISYVINCVGLIKQLISEASSKSVSEAIHVNSQFPRELENLARIFDFKVIQIGTDCVYSGAKGGYTEDETHSPIDVYGMTKSLGEVRSSRVMTIRSSIVGPEIAGNTSLLSWLLSRPLNDELSGYTNHLWNGVTTLHFAKVISGIITSNSFKSGTFHLVPTGVESKGKMLVMFAKYFERLDLKISQIPAPSSVNRTLATTMPLDNSKLWKIAGYNEPPTVEQMIAELAAWTEDHSKGASI
jgi:dTDP-4-dehydrorhamnose reductase